jgi:hypothetical protein
MWGKREGTTPPACALPSTSADIASCARLHIAELHTSDYLPREGQVLHPRAVLGTHISATTCLHISGTRAPETVRLCWKFAAARQAHSAPANHLVYTVRSTQLAVPQ